MEILEQHSQFVLAKMPVSKFKELWLCLQIYPRSANLDFRVYWRTEEDDNWRPTKQGARFQARDWSILEQVITDAKAYVKLNGLEHLLHDENSN